MLTHKNLIALTPLYGIQWTPLTIVIMRVCQEFFLLVLALLTRFPGVNPGQPWYFPEVGFASASFS